jgi:hypothetical protein
LAGLDHQTEGLRHSRRGQRPRLIVPSYSP